VSVEAPACLGCGWCCLTDQCRESLRLHGYLPRCPEIHWDLALRRYRCRLAGHPLHGDRYRRDLDMGQGCCARDNSWRRDVKNRDPA
jgi:hypothetical protein